MFPIVIGREKEGTWRTLSSVTRAKRSSSGDAIPVPSSTSTVASSPAITIIAPGDKGLAMWMCDEAYFMSPDLKELAKHFADYGYMFDDPNRMRGRTMARRSQAANSLRLRLAASTVGMAVTAQFTRYARKGGR